jgi:DNA-binding NarL/FixJ family response regulator
VIPPIRILIADDHPLVRAGIRALLAEIPGLVVVAEAGDGRAALVAVASSRPDLILTEIAMPIMDGLELASRVTRDFPEIRTIILSMHSEEEYLVQAVRAGAVGYLRKESDSAELRLAIEAVARGEAYLSPTASQHRGAGPLVRHGGAVRPPAALSPRQREILRLIASSQTTKAMARTLGISVKTVETHRAQLMQRLQIFDVAGLVRYALRHGLATLDD